MNINKRNKYSIIINYLITYFAYAFSAVGYFSQNKVLYLFFGFFLILYYYKNKNDNSLNLNLRLFILLFYVFLIFISQSFIFEKSNLQAFLVLIFFYFIIPYLIIRILNIKFIDYYLNLITVLAIISLLFWVSVNFIDGFEDLVKELPKIVSHNKTIQATDSFIIHSYERGEAYNLIRNPGATWEPGAWAAFLITALIFSLIKGNKFFCIRNIIIIGTIITTFSTAGYLSLLIIFLYAVLYSRLHYIVKIVTVPIALFFFIKLFTSVELLSDKIKDNYESANSRQINEVESGRFFALRKAIITIKEYPVTGRGLIISSTGTEAGMKEGLGYGIVSIATRFGLIAFILYFIFFFLSIKKLIRENIGVNNGLLWFSYIALIINQFSQGLYSTPIFMIIFFISYLKMNLIPPIKSKAYTI